MFWVIPLLIWILFIDIDVIYFIRTIFTYVAARFIRKKIGLMDPSKIYGICWTSDADFMLVHMNNARYLREYDFGRVDQYTRSGLLIELMHKGGMFVGAGSTIRHRQELKIFSPYEVVSTPIWWDDKFFYYDQKIITLADGIVRSNGIVKLAIIKMKITLDEFIKEKFPEAHKKKPNMPDDLKKWIEYNEVSRINMKAK